MIRTWKQAGLRAFAWVAALLLLSDTSAQVIVSVHAPPAAPGEVTIASVRVDQAAGMAEATW
jgi:hypothetical protein